jgi:hypothetical protein
MGAAAAGQARERSDRIMLGRAFARLDPLALAVAVGIVSGLGLWFGTAVLLLRGGSFVGLHLSRLSYYLPGYSVSWPGAFLGLVEAAVLGFLLGAAVALAWNLYHRWFVALVMARETRRELQEL